MVERKLVYSILRTYATVGLWIFLSGAVIIYNKYILAYSGFPYPISLTLWHMLFCATIATGLVVGNRVDSISMSKETYVRAIVPIGACYAGTLWLGNSAYLYLSISFIQMLKAFMPVAVFTVGCLLGTENFQWLTLANMLVVTAGIAIASYGEINFNLTGVVFQMSSIVTESIRLVLVQILLQSRGLKLNPITTLYYVAPCCFIFLLVPFFAVEFRKIANDSELVVNPFHMIGNASIAFSLNMAVFLLIGKTSALTMNIAGIGKDWILIGLSVLLFHSAISPLNLFGFIIAFLAVGWFNYRKLQNIKSDSTKSGSDIGEQRLLLQDLSSNRSDGSD